MSHRTIISLIKCSVIAVQYALATFCFETFNGYHKHREYQQKIMERENQYIIHTVKQNDTLSLSDITIIINNNLNKLISITTI